MTSPTRATTSPGPTSRYRTNQPVWMWSWSVKQWRPGIVLSASTRAVLVRYQPTDQHGSAVDTVTPDLVTHRAAVAPHQDRTGAPTGPDPPTPDPQPAAPARSP